ncbi:NgoMIV family type II restriction endonuclease [Nocardia sp. NPDC060256]|uniref:NgoMIV family type II restriction endonuclease n=1 Tax=unclassified Nocardia TaxID=2637762 RepID=UPI00365D2C67
MWVPNSADVDNSTSLRLAAHILEQLGDPNPNLRDGTGCAAGESRTKHPWLHAAIACKWTTRSDRVQNIRHENSNMIGHRRGRCHTW